jgi:hypothetical protein
VEWPRDRWELIMRTMIERIGLDQLCEVIESVVTEMRAGEKVAHQDLRARKTEPTVDGSVA